MKMHSLLVVLQRMMSELALSDLCWCLRQHREGAWQERHMPAPRSNMCLNAAQTPQVCIPHTQIHTSSWESSGQRGFKCAKFTKVQQIK